MRFTNRRDEIYLFSRTLTLVLYISRCQTLAAIYWAELRAGLPWVRGV